MINKKNVLRKIDFVAQFGANISRACRNCWTGEQWRTTVPFDKAPGPGGRQEASLLECLGLMALEDVADLRQYRLVKPGQHSWRVEDWKREILAAMGGTE